MSDITRLLDAAAAGNRQAAADLLPFVYDELRKLAAARMAAEKPGDTLQPTALVHEAYLRLVGTEDVSRWDHRGHFSPRQRRQCGESSSKRPVARNGRNTRGQQTRVDLPDIADRDPDDRLLALDDTLSLLAAEDPLAARVVELHHFAGASHEVVADTLGITVYSARQKWTYARAWLRDAMTENF